MFDYPVLKKTPKNTNIDKKHNRTRLIAPFEKGYLMRISHSREKNMLVLLHCIEKMVTRFD